MLLRVFVLLSLFLAMALPAQANVIRQLAAKPGVGDLRMACSRGGGVFSIAADGSGYGCQKKNCDGNGGVCEVACDNNNNCVGSTPTRIDTPTTLIGILQNGDIVVRDPAPTGGTTSLSSPGTGGADPAGAPAVVDPTGANVIY